VFKNQNPVIAVLTAPLHMRSSSAAAVALLAIALTVGVASGLSLILQLVSQSWKMAFRICEF
jgi:hypothetical protein